MEQTQEHWNEPHRRRRLVRLCAVVSGDRAAAEDLAQETLLEAWRNRHKLRDPSGVDAWLAAIARNVCHRWARRRGRELTLVPTTVEPPGPVGVETELERCELVEPLDRALALLPPATRDLLIQHYVHESTQAELGARLGVSADAVSMRLTRAKALLRQAVTAELGLETASDHWHATRVWCRACGRGRLRMRRDPAPGAIAFSCPVCTPGGSTSEFPLTNPFFAQLLGDVVRPTAIIGRAATWSRRYFAGGAGAGTACTRCGRPVRLKRFFRGWDGRPSDGLYVACTACGEQVSSSAAGLAHALEEVRRFGREHPRSRAAPQREVEHGGVAALVVRHEDALGSAGVDVVFARDTLRVLHVATG
jgi:RNA polymerase sigma-70 factor (ECF subfamily)